MSTPFQVAAKCPRCKSRDFSLTRIYEEAEEKDVRNGVLANFCARIPLNEVRAYCICAKCGHEWKPRGNNLEELPLELPGEAQS
jgi:Zn finger protein HypA/HybF involved in hydrogenase expression